MTTRMTRVVRCGFLFFGLLATVIVFAACSAEEHDHGNDHDPAQQARNSDDPTDVNAKILRQLDLP